MSFSPDGRELAFGNSDGNVNLYSVPATYASLNGQIKYQGSFSASSKGIYSVLFLSGDSLVAAGADAVARFWTVPAGNFTPTNPFTVTTPEQSITTHSGAIWALSYSAPLSLLTTGSPLGSRIWDTNPGQVAANICQTLKAPVRSNLWQDYLPDIPYTSVCG